MMTEESLISSMIQDGECIPYVCQIVARQDITLERRPLFDALVALNEQGRQYKNEMNALVKELQAHDALDRIGGIAYIGELLAKSVTAENALQYARDVKEEALERRIRSEMDALATMHSPSNTRLIQDRCTTLAQLLDERQSISGAITERSVPPGLVGILDVKDKVRERLKRTEGSSGWKTGWSTLDGLLGGWRSGETTLVCGHTGGGKSTFASQAALFQCLDRERRVFHCPLEGGNNEALPKLVQQFTGQDPSTMSDEVYDAAVSTLDPLWHTFDHVGPVDIGRFLRVFKYAVEVLECKFAVIDHLHFMVDESDPELLAKIAQIAMAVVTITQKSGCHTLLVAQAKKNADKRVNRDDYIPQIGDVRGLGSATQAVQNMISIYRPRDRSRDGARNEDGTFQAALVVLKNRKLGREGNIRLRYVPASQTYLIDPRDYGK